MNIVRRLWPFGRGHPRNVEPDRSEQRRDLERRRDRTRALSGQLQAVSTEGHRVAAANRALRTERFNPDLLQRLTGTEDDR